MKTAKEEVHHDEEYDDSSDENEPEDEENDINNNTDANKEVYEFNGVAYDTYQDMVQAKRQRNQKILEASGLLDTARKLKEQVTGTSKSEASQRGLKRRKKVDKNDGSSNGVARTTRRKSNRLQRIASDGKFVEEERAGKFTVANDVTVDGTTATTDATAATAAAEPEFFRNRLNDGSDMTLEEALTQHVSTKWATDDALSRGKALFQFDLALVFAPLCFGATDAR